MGLGSKSKHSGLSKMSKKSDDVANYYDNWATDYNETLADWRYEAPEQVASMLQVKLSPQSSILDMGCGTGLCGKALKGISSLPPKEISFSLPPWRYLKRHPLFPDLSISRNSPPPSNSSVGLSEAFAALMAVSARGRVLRAMTAFFRGRSFRGRE